MEEGYRELAAYRHCIENISNRWPAFRQTRDDRLRHGGETERVAEAILEDLFTDVLDWTKGDITYQIDYADIVLSKNLAKYLVVEVKRPGTLWLGRQRFDDAMQQVQRYADKQHVTRIAVSDGRFLHAANTEDGNKTDRVLADLSSPEPPLSLWWLSVHGIYRQWHEPVVWPTAAAPAAEIDQTGDPTLLHPKYKLPSTCFAYVSDSNDPRTWKLPYRTMDGGVTVLDAVG
jgi:hypothetical protein